jgi:hypothetical protein
MAFLFGGGICAVGALEGIYDRYGYHILEKTLRLIIGTWEGDVISLSANMLNGTARLAYAYDEQLKEDLFKEKLSKVSPKDISRTAKERRAGSLGYAEALLIFYNKNKKYPLSYERLYTHKAPVRKRSTSVVEDYSPDTIPDDMQSTIFDIDDAE